MKLRFIHDSRLFRWIWYVNGDSSVWRTYPIPETTKMAFAFLQGKLCPSRRGSAHHPGVKRNG